MVERSSIVCDRFLLKVLVGVGSFGQVWVAECLSTGRLVAAKLEPLITQDPQLRHEAEIYTALHGGTGIPKIHYFGHDAANNVLVMDLLGKSVQDLFGSLKFRFSLKTVLMLADQMLSCLEFIHAKGYVVQDVRPDNFCIGSGTLSAQVFIIDFGLAKSYRRSSGEHIPMVEGTGITGTARYASLNALRGVEQSRRDDLESLGYLIVYLLRGNLPWSGIDAPDAATHFARILDCKARTSLTELCAGLPDEIRNYLTVVRALGFEETPPYAELRQQLRDVLIREGLLYDYRYDWVTSTAGPRRGYTPIWRPGLTCARPMSPQLRAPPAMARCEQTKLAMGQKRRGGGRIAPARSAGLIRLAVQLGGS